MSRHILDVEFALAADSVAARASLERFLLSGPHELSIRLRLDDFGLPGELSLEKEIVMTARLERDRQNINDDLCVSFWGATAPQMFPTFTGVLDVYPDDGGSVLELRGSYDSPLGAAGDFFDAAIGHLIAQRSARALLEEIGERVHGKPVNAP